MKKHSENQQTAAPQSELFEFNLLQLANYLFSNRLWIITGTLLCVGITLFWVVFIKHPIYRASVSINIDLQADDKNAGMNMGVGGFFMQEQLIANKIGITEQYFDSKEFEDFIVTELSVDFQSEKLKEAITVIRAEAKRQSLSSDEEIADWLHGKMELKGFNEKSRIDMIGSGPKPELAAAVANFGAHVLVSYNRTMLVQRLKNLKAFLNTQTLQTKKDLRALEGELVDLQKTAKIISPDEVRVRANSLQIEQEAKLIEFERQLSSINTLITETEADLEYFKKLMQQNNSSSYIYLEQMQKRLELLRYQKLQNIQRSASGEKSDVQDPALEQSIAEILKDLSQQLQSLNPIANSPWDYVKKIEVAIFDLKQKRAVAKSEFSAQRTAKSRTTKEFIGLPDSLRKLSEIKRNLDLTTSLYTTLMTRLQDTQIREAAHSNDLVIVSSAEPPSAPSGLGRTKTTMLSILGGVILSCLPLFLRFVLLPTIRNVKDLSHLHVPIIGAIGWYRPHAVKGITLKLSEKFPRILKLAPNALEANSLRFIRFQIEQALSIRANKAGQASKILMVGSVNPKEGRTFVAANIGDLFASTGVRTCVIDLDFGKPDIVNFFPGATLDEFPMSDLFPTQCGFKMYRVTDKLTILKPNATTENLSELIATREFESALNALEILFELIILDTPPLTGYMEPVMTAQYADAFLLVVNQRRTLRTEVEEAVRIFQGSLKIPIYGVMNFVFDELSNSRRKKTKTNTRGGEAEPEKQERAA